MLEPTHTLELIGPAEAKDLLSKNTHNRTLRPSIISLYTRAMDTGKWNFDGSPLRISTENVLLDGQHRLLAIIDSGTAQMISIWHNIKPEAQASMDTGRKRSIADALHLRGEVQCAGLGAVLGLATRWESGLRGSTLTAQKTAMQIPELLEYLDQHPGIRNSLRPGYSVARRVPINASVTVLAHYLFTTISEEDAAAFFDSLSFGIQLAEDSPVFQLRAALTRAKRPGSTTAPHIYLALLIKAWNAYRSGRTVKLLSFKAGGAHPDSFPEPI